MQYFRQRLKAATLSSLPIVAWWWQSSHSNREQWSDWYEASRYAGWRDAAPCWRGPMLFILPHLIIIDNARPEKLLMSEAFQGTDSKLLTLISWSSSLCAGFYVWNGESKWNWKYMALCEEWGQIIDFQLELDGIDICTGWRIVPNVPFQMLQDRTKLISPMVYALIKDKVTQIVEFSNCGSDL